MHGIVFECFQVKFHGEEAEDVGGVKKEFFMLLLREILDPKYGMFKEYEETRTIWFNSDTLEDEIMYFLIGLLCGLAIYNFIIIDLPFPLALYKKLLGESVGLNDIKDMSPIMAKYVIFHIDICCRIIDPRWINSLLTSVCIFNCRSMQSILDYNEPDFEEVFCLNFEITREVFGEQKSFDLLPGGSKVSVTLKNKYVSIIHMSLIVS